MIPPRTDVFAAWRAGRLGELVERVLEPVIGEPFMGLGGHPFNKMVLGFGDLVPTRRDPEAKVARHVFQVSCPLRLDSSAGVLIASADIHRPRPDRDSATDFDPWSTPDESVLADSLRAYWAQHKRGSAVLEHINADAFGGLELGLSNCQTIKLFPRTSGVDEHWRYREIGGERGFVVVRDPDGRSGSTRS